MQKARRLFFLLPVLLGVCAALPAVAQAPAANQAIQVYSIVEAVPDWARVIDTLTISNTAFKDYCSYEVVLEHARVVARKAGGNAIKILQHERPELPGTCHGLVAAVLYLPPYHERPRDPALADPDYDIPYPALRIALDAGWSTRTGKISGAVPPEFHDYIKKLKRGFHLGLDAAYYTESQVGFGLKYRFYNASNSEQVYVSGAGGTSQMELSDQIFINFLGPTVNTRLWDSDDKNALYMGMGLGYLGYRNNSSLGTYKANYSGSTVGLSCDLGYDFGLDRNNAFGIQVSYTIGALTRYKETIGNTSRLVELEKDKYEDLSRIDLTIGMRFNK
ncbi:autotransporter outer membrane beta-barrel domain-containing protein [Botryobacter ruber]|uniref:autotransporter outer membrane beta-barrel domain-containing protein n=1 Tax=Botryobacter ruber TaxID=2171629 RepID=UPI000E0C6723|nr:autotransporter outer membrane beta-barrel domain-containing protein [Botryobacter ruber]